jgi:hypothetical protein
VQTIIVVSNSVLTVFFIHVLRNASALLSQEKHSNTFQGVNFELSNPLQSLRS